MLILRILTFFYIFLINSGQEEVEMETSTPISPPPSFLSMPLKQEHQSPVPQPPRVSSPQQDPSTWPSPGHVTRTSLQMRLQQMAGQPTADEKKAGPTQPMQQSPPVQVSSLFKDARSVSFYPYNRSQILQYVEYTK